MTVNLHLALNESVVRRIKSYAARRKVSVSRVVEEQLEEILRAENKSSERGEAEKEDNSFKEFLERYGGSIKRDKPINIDEERVQYLKEKRRI